MDALDTIIGRPRLDGAQELDRGALDRAHAAGAAAMIAGLGRQFEDAGATASEAGVDALELSTDDDLIDAIRRFADMRKRRSRLSAAAPMPSHLEVMQ